MSLDLRKTWERSLFGDAYENSPPFDRVKYGVLNVFGDYRGVSSCARYGDSYLELKGARLRTTFSAKDSHTLAADRLACIDFYAHTLNEFPDNELRAMIELGR